jgi:hypothetical protein
VKNHEGLELLKSPKYSLQLLAKISCSEYFSGELQSSRDPHMGIVFKLIPT